MLMQAVLMVSVSDYSLYLNFGSNADTLSTLGIYSVGILFLGKFLLYKCKVLKIMFGMG